MKRLRITIVIAFTLFGIFSLYFLGLNFPIIGCFISGQEENVISAIGPWWFGETIQEQVLYILIDASAFVLMIIFLCRDRFRNWLLQDVNGEFESV